MTCEYKTNENKKSCDSYIKGGMCMKPNMFRCLEYIERNEPTLSHSGIMNFIRCPKLFYYSSIQGVKSIFESDPIKIGNAVDSYITIFLLTGKTNKDFLPLNTDIKFMWQAKSIAIIRSFIKLINVEKYMDLYSGQYKFTIHKDGHPSVRGIIDLDSNNGKTFIELKVGKSPEYYINKFYIKYKLATYFMAKESYQSGRVWAIKVPQLKRTGKFKNETLAEYSARCYRVMVAEARNYFPGYNSKTKNFGTKFGRVEIECYDMWGYYRMIADWIKMSIKRDLWMEDGGGCHFPFECDYFSICSNNGVISEDLYTFREKK